MQEYPKMLGNIMSTAFVLFKCQPQRELEVYLALLEIDSVNETHVAYGEYELKVH